MHRADSRVKPDSPYREKEDEERYRIIILMYTCMFPTTTQTESSRQLDHSHIIHYTRFGIFPAKTPISMYILCFSLMDSFGVASHSTEELGPPNRPICSRVEGTSPVPGSACG